MTAAQALSHKELTAHIRLRLRASGVKARCAMQEYCGNKVISVVPPTCDARFTPEEQREIRLIAQVNGLTRARGGSVDIGGAAVDGAGIKLYLGYAA